MPTAKITEGTQAFFGYSDKQAEELRDNQAKYINSMQEHMKYNLVAEVVGSENCAWQAKVGDRIVLRGLGGIAPGECSNKEFLCIDAVAPLQSLARIFLDRVSSGLDPNGSVYRSASCSDTGAEHCGWGRIVMEARAEKVPA